MSNNLYQGIFFEDSPTPEMLNPNFKDVSEILKNDRYLAELQNTLPISAYNILIATSSLVEMFNEMMKEENRALVYELTAEEIAILNNKVNEMYNAIESPSEDDLDYRDMLLDTFAILPNGDSYLDGNPKILLQGSPLTVTSGNLATGTYYLEKDTYLTSFLSVGNGNQVTLDLNGYALIGEGYDDGIGESRNFTIAVYGDASKLTIIDSRPTTTHTIDINNEGVAVYPGTSTTITGGFIYNKGVGKGILTSGTTILTAGSIIGCKGLIGAGVTVSSVGTFEMTGGAISYNKATSASHGGGAIYAEPMNANGVGGILKITNGTITYNSSVGFGGGIFGYNVTVENSTIANNTANLSSGAIYMTSETSSLIINNCTLHHNKAISANGGAIYGVKLDLKDSELSFNTSPAVGGAIYMPDTAISMQLNNVSFLNNEAETAGAVFYRAGVANIINCTFKDNVSNLNGGGLYGYHGSITIQDTNFINNSTNKWGGGCLNWNSSPMEMSNCYFENNSATHGGGLMICQGITASLTNNCQFINNHATEYGGAIFVGEDMVNIASAMSLTNVTISENSSDIDGGGIYTAMDSTTTMIDADILNNTAMHDGGGIYIANGNLNFISGTIDGNSSINQGGGVYCDSGVVSIGVEACEYLPENSYHTIEPYTHLKHPTVKNNSSNYGGGLFVTGVNASITQYCGEIFNNSGLILGENMYIEDGHIVHIKGEIGESFNSGIVNVGGIFESIEESQIKQEISFYSTLLERGTEKIFNGRIPISKTTPMPNAEDLFSEDTDENSVIWRDLFPQYKFNSWKRNLELDTETSVALQANWVSR